MCGITGFVDFKRKTGRDYLEASLSTLKHRGPDDDGHILIKHEKAIVGLGQTRLSILDLTDRGRQPMEYYGLSVVFNGEIYNFKEIRSELLLKGYKFDSNSDTEVLLKAFHCWGGSSVDRFVGMFAFAIFDEKNTKLSLYRDRAGVKPLYYYWHNGLFLFASELKAFHQHRIFQEFKRLDNNALSLFLMLGYIPSPHCIFEDTFKLPPGHSLEIDLVNKAEIRLEQYWSTFDFLEKPRLQIGSEEAEKSINELLISACKYRMVSDVPVGVFLSGGYDSSLVTAILQEQQNKPIKTFTIGFDSKKHSEAEYALTIAKHLGTEHHTLACSSEDFLRIFESLPEVYDEPMADDSAIPTLLLSRFAKQEVKVAISADGGDELFAGYNKHMSLVRDYQKLTMFPPQIAKNATIFLQSIASSVNNIGLEAKLAKLYQFYSLQCESSSISNLLQVKHLQFPFEKVNSWLIEGTINPLHVLASHNSNHLLGHALATDYYQNMSDAIVVKLERASMSHGLEAREPLLDHRLYEFVAQLPDEVRNKKGTQKSLLKSIAKKYMPSELLDRPKQGFTPPLSEWSKAKDFVELKSTFLNPLYLKQQGVFNDTLLKDWGDFKGPLRTRFEYNLLTFQLWYEKWMV